MTIVDRPEVARAALSPLRRRILAELDAPASATEVATALGLPRQKVNYHMTVLEGHGLVELAEVRQRRGFRERRFRRSGVVVIAPDLVDPSDPGDDMSAEAIVAAAGDAIRAVGSLAASGSAHPTATVTTEISFGSPADFRAFLDGVAELAAGYDRIDEPDALTMKITLLSHVAKGHTP